MSAAPVHSERLTDLWRLGPSEVVALVGAGGKTSLMEALARDHEAEGSLVVLTTTTKILPPPPGGRPLVTGSELETVLEALRAVGLGARGDGAAESGSGGSVRRLSPVVGRGLTTDGKLVGVPAEWVPALRDLPGVAAVLVEADGAVGRPLKAPAEYEPVVPGCASLVVAVAGLDAQWAPLDAGHVHRPELVSRLLGLPLGGPIPPAALLRACLEGYEGSVPGHAGFLVLFNKADLLPPAAELAEASAAAGAEVWSGSVGRLAEDGTRGGVRGMTLLGTSDRRPSVLIPAAGLALRMGGPKVLARLGRDTVVGTVVSAVRESGVAREVVVVAGDDAAAVEAALPPERPDAAADGVPRAPGPAVPASVALVRVVRNPTPAEGMASSLRTGLAALRRPAGVLVALGDMPLIRPATLRSILAARDERPRSAAIGLAGGAAAGVRPPLLLHRSVVPQILELRGDEGARSVLARYPGAVVGVPGAPQEALDVDSPEDLDRARRLAGSDGPPPDPRRRSGGPPAGGALAASSLIAVMLVALVVAAAALLLSACSPLIESAPRAGTTAGASGGSAAGGSTSTSDPASSIHQAPPLLGGLPEPTADDGGWRTLTLTGSGDTHAAPSFDDHYVVWQGRDSRDPDPARHDDEIYLYDFLTGETRMLSDDDLQDIAPQIREDWVVWLRYQQGGGDVELVAHELSTGLTRVLAADVAAVGSGMPGGGRDFVLGAGAVVWTAGEWPATEIHYYDLRGGTETVVSDGRGRNRSPDTDGRFVVWLSQTAEGEAVMLAEPYRGVSRVLADVTPGRDAPQVDAGLVVWSGWDGSDAEIFLCEAYDAEPGDGPLDVQRLSDNTVDDLAPRIDGGMVAWREGAAPSIVPLPSGAPSPDTSTSSPGASASSTVTTPAGGTPPARIVLYEHAAGTRRVLADDVGAEAFPEVSGGLVFWGGSPSEGGGFVLYDAASEQTVTLGRKLIGAGYPVSGEGGHLLTLGWDGALVWSGWEGAAPQIVVAYRGVRPVEPVRTGRKASFTDVKASPYAGAIESLFRAGVFEPPVSLPTATTTTTAVGGAFHPDGTLTRVEATAWIETALGAPASAAPPVATRPLTRGQFVSLVVRALRSEHPGAVQLLPVGFTGTVQYDDPDHGDDLLLAEHNRLLDGLGGFSLSWDVWRPVTRGEAAQILANAVSLVRDAGPSTGGAPAAGVGAAGLLAPSSLSDDETARAFREKAAWSLTSAELGLGVVEVSEGPDGLWTVHLTLEAAHPEAPDMAVGEFMDGAIGRVGAIASVLNKGRGAQIGLVRTELTGVDGLALVSHTYDLEGYGRQTLEWDPSVDEAAQEHFSWPRPYGPAESAPQPGLSVVS